MTVNRQVLALDRQVRDTLTGATDRRTRELVTAWARAWDDVAGLLERALLDAAPGAEMPPAHVLARDVRVRSALRVIEGRLRELTADLSTSSLAEVAEVVHETADLTEQMLVVQAPPIVPTPATAPAIDAIVQRTAGRIESQARPLSRQQTARMRRSLTRAVVTGQHPYVAAKAMVDGVRRDFTGGLSRALTISRTELADAYRTASATVQQANADVLAGWEWVADLTERTCPACWGMHGTRHPLDEPGPLDHQNGRCTRVPVTKSWRELGIAGREPVDAVPDAPSVFRSLSADTQQRIMGPSRLAALKDGRLSWGDLASRRSSNAWRDSYVPSAVPAA